MDIELLKTFVEVTQTRHFGRAAENLFLTPAAVSARIRQLEQILGVTLLYRTRGNIQMSAEGERLLPHAHQLLQLWALVRQDMASQAEPASHLRLGATSGLWSFVLGNLSQLVRAQLPDLTLRAEAYPQDELLERLLAEQLDMVLIYDLPGDGALKSRRVGQLSLAMLSSAPGMDLPTALKQEYVFVDWGAAFALFHARRFGELNSRLYTNQVSVALDYLAATNGCAYLPESLTAEAKGGQLHRVEGAPGFTRPIYAAYRAENEYAQNIQKLLPLLGF